MGERVKREDRVGAMKMGGCRRGGVRNERYFCEWNALKKNLYVKYIIYRNCWGGWVQRGGGMVIPPAPLGGHNNAIHYPLKIVLQELASNLMRITINRQFLKRGPRLVFCQCHISRTSYHARTDSLQFQITLFT